MKTVAGDRARFALGFELGRDPDPAGDPARRASWGELEVWVGGRNLTAGIARDGSYLAAARCPLLPIVEWLVEVWDHLLHEERFPRRSPEALSSASWSARALLEALDREGDGDDALEGALADREAWWGRHGLGAALPDFRIPDLHLRRRGPDIELSWDDREWRSVDSGVVPTEPRGATALPVAEVAQVLERFCRAVLLAVAASEDGRERAGLLLAELDALGSPERQEGRLRLAAGQGLERAARWLLRRAGLGEEHLPATLRRLAGIAEPASPGLYAVLPVPILLLRSVSPRLSETDLDRLLELGERGAASPGALAAHQRQAGCPSEPDDVTRQGCGLATRFRESVGIPAEAPLTGDRDLEEGLLPALGVEVLDLSLEDRTVEGAAVWRPGAGPVVGVNLQGRFAHTPWGRRMTLAHELCHLLHDAAPPGGVGVVSNPWAAYLPERRANAFAATLLAPEPAIAALLDPSEADRWTVRALRRAMDALGVGATTLTWQLRNLGWITASDRVAWMEELAA